MQLALEKKERLSPSPCMHAASIWGEGKFCLDREFSKNAPYKQKIIFHLASSDKMEQKKFFFAWTVDWWYLKSHCITTTYFATEMAFLFFTHNLWKLNVQLKDEWLY